MKKYRINIGLGALLGLLVISGCSNSDGSKPASISSGGSPSSTQGSSGSGSASSSGVSKPEEQSPDAGKREDSSASCKKNEDCFLIPRGGDGCLGCFGENGGHDATNFASFINFTRENAPKCRPMFEEKAKSLKEGERPQKISKDPSCAFNATDCVNGVCVLTKVSPEEERARAEKRMKEMQPPAGNQGGPQGGAQAGPPPSNGHSYKPQGVPNGNGPSNGKAAPAMNPRGPQAN